MAKDIKADILIPEFIVIQQDIIDRAAMKAINACPTARKDQILKALRSISISKYHPEIINVVIESTAPHEDSAQRTSGDDSGEMFISQFRSEFIRLAVATYICSQVQIKKIEAPKQAAELMIMSFCASLHEFMLDENIDGIVPYVYDHNIYQWVLNERVDDSAWLCAAMQLITTDEYLRHVNAKVKSSDAEFIQRCAKILVR